MAHGYHGSTRMEIQVIQPMKMGVRSVKFENMNLTWAEGPADISHGTNHSCLLQRKKWPTWHGAMTMMESDLAKCMDDDNFEYWNTC